MKEVDASACLTAPPAATTQWRYTPSNGKPILTRRNPEIDGEKTTHRIQPDAVFEVEEERLGVLPGVIFLRLSQGGWLFDAKPGLGVMCTRCTETTDAADMKHQVEVALPAQPPPEQNAKQEQKPNQEQKGQQERIRLKEECAAATIQARARGNATRKNVASIKAARPRSGAQQAPIDIREEEEGEVFVEEEVEEDASMRALEVVLAAPEVPHLSANLEAQTEHDLHQKELTAEEAAALRIQAAARGNVARHKVVQMRAAQATSAEDPVASAPKARSCSCCRCGAAVQQGQQLCDPCAAAGAAGCDQCGNTLFFGQRFCGQCGASVSDVATEKGGRGRDRDRGLGAKGRGGGRSTSAPPTDALVKSQAMEMPRCDDAPEDPSPPSGAPLQRRPPRKVRPPPDVDFATSEVEVRRRAQLQLERTAARMAQNIPSIVSRPQPFEGLPKLKLDDLSQTAQSTFMRVARYEVEAWLKIERQRYVWETTQFVKQSARNEKLDDWYQKREQEERDKRLHEEEMERQRELEEHEKELGRRRRNEELQKKVAEWANKKDERDRECMEAAERAAKEEEIRRKALEERYRAKQKIELEEWHRIKAEKQNQEAMEAEERRRRLRGEEEEQMRSGKELRARAKAAKAAARCRRSGGSSARRRQKCAAPEEVVGDRPEGQEDFDIVTYAVT